MNFKGVFIVTLTAFFIAFDVTSVLASDLTGDWVSTEIMPFTLASHGAFVRNGSIYVVGGADFFVGLVSLYSNIQASGSISPWSYSLEDPPPVFWHSVINKDDYVYIIGGSNLSASPLKAVYKGTIQLDGSIQFWQNLPTELPETLALGAGVVVGDRIYYGGGFTGGGTRNDDIYMTAVGDDGSLSGWNWAGKLPEPLEKFGMVEANGKLIVIGGEDSGGVTAQVRSASINGDGMIGTWTELPTLPKAISRSGVSKVGNTMVTAGGISAGNLYLSDVYYSEIDGSGNTGVWNPSAFLLPFANCCFPLAVWQNKIYVTGGHDGHDYFNSVYWTRVGPDPTPTPELVDLDVPHLMQDEDPWGDDIYDQATEWSANPTVARWGCALTSAAMVLQYHGHETTNPDSLNEWLKLQPDGYIRNGLVNWLAVSRYSQEHDGEDSPTLVYRRYLGTDLPLLTAELTAERPAILREPGHFVVARSQTPDSFGINDPAYETKTTLADYVNSYEYLGSYMPTHSDLSYILLVVDGDVGISVTGPDGNPITGHNYVEESLADAPEGTSTSGEGLNSFWFPEPPDGEYRISLSGAPGSYSLDTYLYDKEGNPTLTSYEGLLGSSEIDVYRAEIGSESAVNYEVTIGSLIADLENAYDQGLIYKSSIYRSLYLKLQLIKLQITFGQEKAAEKGLKAFAQHVEGLGDNMIDPAAVEVLGQNATLLQKSLL